MEEERFGGRGHVLPEEGATKPPKERMAQDRARPTGGAATAAQESEELVFEIRMKKWKEKKRTMGPTNIKWWKCKDEMMVEYRERVRRKCEELDAEKGTVDGELRQYKDAFVGGGRRAVCSSGKGGTSRRRNQGWWTEEVAKAGRVEDDRRH